ncbi:unnamed protein product [Lactuca saligna]|uniref:MULE transposase domain-containing protein n=1 Tax=Lactuca saligna TaxID=75948 RepID=A0AA36E5Q0_LACSI|nr:unnamed protein product [Lactuca saligna]
MWHLRLSSTSFDPRVVYDGHPTLFTIKLHHGGEFTKYPNVNYIEGTVTYVDMEDIEEFSIHEMDAIMKGLGYSVPPIIYYHFRVPKGDMHFGLRALGNDGDVLNLAQIGGNKDDAANKFEHGFNEFDKACNDINQYFNEFHEACNDIDQGFNEFDEAANDFDIGLYQQILQSNEQNVDDEVHEGEENAFNKEVTEEENHDRNKINDENVDMRDFAVDDGSEDNIETDEENHERSDESEDSDNSDLWVDENNIILDVEVDMRDFYINIDLEAEFLEKRLSNHRENESDEVNEELDVIDNDQSDSLDEGSDIERKRLNVIKELGKETICYQGEIHKGDYKKQYDVLRDYIQELQSINPETTIKLEFDSELSLSATSRRFKRMYVCLGGMNKRFRACLRDFLGFDGAFMKGPFPGKILTAVGVDSNNGIYPLSYAIVETENTDSWKWFLECITDDLDLYANSKFTFISHRQKVWIVGCHSQLFPCAEHRICLGHIHDNMRKTWRTNEYKEHLWNCATTTTVPEFNHRMQQFSSYDIEAYNWLKQIPPQHWERSHFTGRAVSDMLLNNLCEVFNSKLIKGRDKPLITCLEYIREYMMKRICIIIKVKKKCVDPLTPSATKIMEKNVNWASQYTARWNGSDKYQVEGPWQDQHVVDMLKDYAVLGSGN